MENKKISAYYDVIFIIGALLIYVYASILNLHHFELTRRGGSNDEFVSVFHAITVSQNWHSPRSIYWLLVSQRMPFAYLFIVPITFFVPLNELTLRLPNILFGAAIILVLYPLAKRVFNRTTAILSILLYLSSGMFAVNRLTLGVSNCVFFITLGFFFLTRINREAKTFQYRYVIYSALSLLVANLTFQDVLMFSFGGIAVLLIMQHQFKWPPSIGRRYIVIFCSIYWGTFFLYYLSSIIAFGLYNYIMHRPIDFRALGTIAQYIERTHNGIGNNNLLPYIRTYLSYNSLPHSVVFFIGLALSFLVKNRYILLIWSYTGFHVLAWMFIMPDRLFEHPLFTLPLFSLIASASYDEIFYKIRHSRYIYFFSYATFIGLCGGSYFLNVSYLNNVSFSDTRKIPAHGMIANSGLKTAGYLIREQTSLETIVWFYRPELLQGISFYANRPAMNIERLEDVAALQEGVIISTPDSPANETFMRHFPSKIIIMRNQETLLYVYFIRQTAFHEKNATYDADVYDKKYDALFQRNEHYNNLLLQAH